MCSARNNRLPPAIACGIRSDHQDWWMNIAEEVSSAP